MAFQGPSAYRTILQMTLLEGLLQEIKEARIDLGERKNLFSLNICGF
jgi:hypothetical protein